MFKRSIGFSTAAIVSYRYTFCLSGVRFHFFLSLPVALSCSINEQVLAVSSKAK